MFWQIQMESTCAPSPAFRISPSLLDVQAFFGKDGTALLCREGSVVVGCVLCCKVTLHKHLNHQVTCSSVQFTPHLSVTSNSDGSVLLISVQRCSTGSNSQNQQEDSGLLAHCCNLFHSCILFTLIPVMLPGGELAAFYRTPSTLCCCLVSKELVNPWLQNSCHHSQFEFHVNSYKCAAPTTCTVCV